MVTHWGTPFDLIKGALLYLTTNRFLKLLVNDPIKHFFIGRFFRDLRLFLLLLDLRFLRLSQYSKINDTKMFFRKSQFVSLTVQFFERIVENLNGLSLIKISLNMHLNVAILSQVFCEFDELFSSNCFKSSAFGQ